MSNGFRKVEVLPPMYSEFGQFETSCKFNKPNRHRRYIKILALCLTPVPTSLIYPNTKHPLMHQVRDLCRHGYLERLERTGERKYYYHTTHKGQDLIIKALEVR